MKGDFVLCNPRRYGFNTSCATDIGDLRHFCDMGDFFRRLDHAHAHGRGGDIDELDARKFVFQQSAEFDAHVIELDC
jgi:hypothetical protein